MERSEAARKWRKRIAEQSQSGLNIAEFCKKHGISREGFFQWRKRLKVGKVRREFSSGVEFIEVGARAKGTVPSVGTEQNKKRNAL